MMVEFTIKLKCIERKLSKNNSHSRRKNSLRILKLIYCLNLRTHISKHIIIIIIIIIYSLEFFTSFLADGLSLEFEW